MKAFGKILFATLMFAAISLSVQKESLLPSVDICRLFKNGVILRKPGTCNEAIICENFQSKFYKKCDGATPWYALTTSTCVAAKPKDSYCSAPCKKTSPTFVVDAKNCNYWYQCSGTTQINYGPCPEKMVFNQKKQICTYEDETTCVATYEFCDVVPTNIEFANESNCHKYQKCGKKLESLSCPVGEYFDRELGVCNKKAQVDCYKHPYPDEVCGNSKISYRNKFVSDEASCRGYFYCKDKGTGVPDTDPAWGQCPLFQFFNAAEEACQNRAHVKCDEDRCDGRLEGEKEISGKKGCQHYLICGNGYTKSEEYCGDGKYFDAELNQCTNIKHNYVACA